MRSMSLSIIVASFAVGSLVTVATSCGFGLHSSASLGSEMLKHWLVAWHHRIPSLESPRRHRLRCLASSASRQRQLAVAVGIAAVQGILSLQLVCPGIPFLRGSADRQRDRPSFLSVSSNEHQIWLHMESFSFFWLESLLQRSSSGGIRLLQLGRQPVKCPLCLTRQAHL